MPIFSKEKENLITVKQLWMPMCNRDSISANDISIYLLSNYKESEIDYERHPLTSIDDIQHWFDHKVIKWMIEDYHLWIWVTI